MLKEQLVALLHVDGDVREEWCDLLPAPPRQREEGLAKRTPGWTGIDQSRGHHGEHMKNEVGAPGRALVEVRLLPWSAAFSARSAVRREGIETYREPEVGIRKDNGEGIAYRFLP